MRMYSRAAAVAAAVVIIGAGARAADQQPAAPAPPPPASAATVAKVNGVAIPRADFDRNWQFFLQSSGIPAEQAAKDGEVEEFRAQVLDRLVDEELLYQEAQKRKLAAGKEDVDAEIAKARTQFPTPQAFAEALANNRLTEEGLRTLLGRNLSIQALVEKGIAAGLAVPDAEVREFYAANQESFEIPEQVRARHILVEFDEQDDDAAKKAKRAKIEGLLAQLKGGASFEDLARANSDCPSAAEGGDLGFFGRGQMVPAFDEAVFALKPGETSGVIETEYGYHVVRLEERKAAGMVPEKEAAPQITEYLRSQKTEAAVEALLEELRKASTIEKLL
jgi:peptidyl-prolyl cis-trans isomerase C